MDYTLQRENARRVPEYMRGNLEEALSRIQATPADVMFAFVTDVHIHAAGMSCVGLLRELAERAGLERTFCGGDLPWAFGSREECLQDAQESLELLGTLREQMGLYIMRGNHDLTIRTSWEDASGYTAPYGQTVQLLAGYTTPDVIRPGEEAYYYVDDAARRIRWIVLDTCLKETAPETQSWGTRYGVDEAQIRWLATEALSLPEGGEGWVVFALGHIPCVAALPGGEAKHGFDQLAGVLKDFKNRRATPYADFTGAQADLAAYLCGHNHVDADVTEDGVPFISTSSSACLQDDVWKREMGADTEELFDLFLLDRTARRLHAVRVGAGKDRTFCY